jgi:hypothetical protein
MEELNKLLDSQKDRFDNLVIIGTNNDGKISIASSFPNIGPVHHLLNRTIFEMNIFENQALLKNNQEVITEKDVQ